jgi:predicted PurR-regulated permease PerM
MAMVSSPARTSFLRSLIALVLIVASLYLARTIIVPIALAILLTFVLAPVVSAVQWRWFGRIPAVLLTAVLTFVLFGLVGWLVVVQVRDLARELPTHRKEIDAKIAGLREHRQGTFGKVLEMMREIGKGETEAVAAAAAAAPKETVIVAQAQDSSRFEQLANAAGPVVEPLAQTGLVVVLVIFMLIKREDLRNRVIALLGHGRLTGTTRVLVDSAQRLSRFLLTQLLINVGFGILFTLGLFFAGVPYALLWGFFIAILRFVPYIGSMVAVCFPLVLAFAVAPGWTQPILVVVLFAVLELVTANVVEPLLFGHGSGVTPIALLVAAAFWTWIWGPIGLVLSTPLTVCLVVLGQHVPRLQFFALVLGDKPPLDPYVSYYQRLLARDQQEAKQVVAQHARTSAREKLYDEVLLPALVLARRDRMHAGLSAEDEAFIFQSTKNIVESLSDPVTPGPESSPETDADAQSAVRSPTRSQTGADGVLVLGFPAHHEAEELSLSMLAQLLQPDGVRVEVFSTGDLPAEVETRVEREDPALVFIAILPPGGIVQARYLCRRIRKRFADLPIVVGYWGDERHYDKVLARLGSAGASYVTTSLVQTRSQIRELVSRNAKAGPVPPARGDLSGNHSRGIAQPIT